MIKIKIYATNKPTQHTEHRHHYTPYHTTDLTYIIYNYKLKVKPPAFHDGVKELIWPDNVSRPKMPH